MKDNPIASSRRNTPVQVQGQRTDVNPQERPKQPLFPHPPVQRYNPMVIPQIAMHNLTPQEEERECREHSQKSPQKQMKEVRTLRINSSCEGTMSVPSLQINEGRGAHERDREQESDPDQNGYVFNCIHESRAFTVNDVGRPVFVNYYYAGEAFIPVTNKKLTKLDECDVSTEISLRNAQPQGMEHKFKEHSQNPRITWQPEETEKGQVQ